MRTSGAPFLAVLGIIAVLCAPVPLDSDPLQDVVAESSAGSELMTYKLAPGDVVIVSVWKSEELGATVPVRPDGRISLPLLGDVEVAGRTPEETRHLLTEQFSQFVTAPSVSVVISEINSWKVYVLGEVKLPGAYDVVSPLRVLQVIAMAGGFTEYAKKDELVLLRGKVQKEERTVISMKAIVSGRDGDQNILLRPGDTLVVP